MDYAVADLAQRRRLVLSEARAAGVPWLRAAVVTAAAANETNTYPSIPRDPALLYDDECYECRPLLKLERRGIGSAGGESKAVDYLTTRGGLIGTTLIDRHGQATDALARTDSPSSPNDELARFFEFIMIERNSPLLRLFSIGFTQMYLEYSPLAGTTSSYPGRFPTWDSLFHYYMSGRGGADIADPQFDYLPVDVSDYPYPGTDSRSYLQQHQTGFVDWESSTWSAYANRFESAVSQVWLIGAELGYAPT
jgi:hypothetical protein